MQSDKLVFLLEDASDSYIESFVKDFMEKNLIKINELGRNVYHDFSKISQLAFQEIISSELKKACYSFVNNNHDPGYIESYLFSCIYKTIKIMNNENKGSVFICPGCKFFSRIEICQFSGKKLTCNRCKNALVNAKEKWEENFFLTFAEHSKKGFRCHSCDNFIPESNGHIVSCPYPKCTFVGPVESLKSIRHPSIKASLEIFSSLEMQRDEFKSSDAEAIIKDDLELYLKVLKDCISAQSSQLQYKSNNSTLINKTCMYEAFKNIIDRNPEEMISYLVFLNRNVRMQHIIFQEFVRLLEERIPFSFKKNGKTFEVKSLLDENLCVFDGLSDFSATVDSNSEIPNNTEELYVGSRKGSYCRPYYIGKVIDIYDVSNNISIFNDIKDYTFFKIVMNDNIKSGTEVIVKHLRIPPHYQMGGMVYLNRIRRAIVDKVYLTIYGKKREIKR